MLGGKKLFRLLNSTPRPQNSSRRAVHITKGARRSAPAARALDYDVTVVESRPAFCQPRTVSTDVSADRDVPDVSAAARPLNVDH